MATTTNYSWTTPDDTALVKDGAAAIRSLGTAIDTTVFTNAGAAVAKATVDAKGDLIAGTADNTIARLAVGANDTVLTADSSTATGLKWAAASAGGSDWSLFNSGGTALTGAQTVTVSGISGKDKIMVLVRGASSASADATINLRLNTDTGANYNFAGLRMTAFTTYDKDMVNAQNSTNATSILIGGMANQEDSSVSGAVVLDGCNGSGLKVFRCAGAGTPFSNGHVFVSTNGFYNSASTISSISIFSSSGNLDAGTVFVYTSAS